MEYDNNKTCNYSNLGVYQTAKCGQGVRAPQWSGLPFLSQFKQDEVQDLQQASLFQQLPNKGYSASYNPRNCCDVYTNLGDAYNQMSISKIINDQKLNAKMNKFMR